MKQSMKNAVKFFLISAVTLAVGYGITMLSFNLFGELSAPQLRGVFAADILALLGAGAGVYCFFENKKSKAHRRAAMEKRHAERRRRCTQELYEINTMLAQANNKVA